MNIEDDAKHQAVTGRLIEVGRIVMGDFDDGEVGEWEVDIDQKTVDAINELRSISVKNLTLFVAIE